MYWFELILPHQIIPALKDLHCIDWFENFAFKLQGSYWTFSKLFDHFYYQFSMCLLTVFNWTSPSFKFQQFLPQLMVNVPYYFILQSSGDPYHRKWKHLKHCSLVKVNICLNIGVCLISLRIDHEVVQWKGLLWGNSQSSKLYFKSC